MGCTLHQHHHTHEGPNNAHVETGHTQPSQSFQTKENINVKAAFIHVIGDFVQSLGVFVAALIIYFKPAWKIVDPICTFIFSVLVLGTTVSILRNTMNVLMEGKLWGMLGQIKQTIPTKFIIYIGSITLFHSSLITFRYSSEC